MFPPPNAAGIIPCPTCPPFDLCVEDLTFITSLPLRVRLRSLDPACLLEASTDGTSLFIAFSTHFLHTAAALNPSFFTSCSTAALGSRGAIAHRPSCDLPPSRALSLSAAVIAQELRGAPHALRPLHKPCALLAAQGGGELLLHARDADLVERMRAYHGEEVAAYVDSVQRYITALVAPALLGLVLYLLPDGPPGAPPVVERAYALCLPLWAIAVQKLWRWQQGALQQRWRRVAGGGGGGGGGGGAGWGWGGLLVLPLAAGSPPGGSRGALAFAPRVQWPPPAPPLSPHARPRAAQQPLLTPRSPQAALQPPPLAAAALQQQAGAPAPPWTKAQGLTALFVALPIMAIFSTCCFFTYLQWQELRMWCDVHFHSPQWEVPLGPLKWLLSHFNLNLSPVLIPVVDQSFTLCYILINTCLDAAAWALSKWLAGLVLRSGWGRPSASQVRALALQQHTALLLVLWHAPFAHLAFHTQNLTALSSSVFSFVVVKRFFIDPAVQGLVPKVDLLLARCRAWWCRGSGGRPLPLPHLPSLAGRPSSATEAALQHARDADSLQLDDEYTSMFVQLSIVLTWGAVFPLAPLFCLLGDVWELRIDTVKLGDLRRYVGDAFSPLLGREGLWSGAVRCVAYVAVVVNAGLLLVGRMGNTPSPHGVAPGWGGATKNDLWEVLCWEHGAALAMAVVDVLLPDGGVSGGGEGGADKKEV